MERMVRNTLKPMEKLMQPSEGYVPIERGLHLYYRMVGEGSNAVIISSAHFLEADLVPLAQGHRLVFYDARGRGRSDADLDESHIWTDYELRDLEAVCQHLGLERVSLIGWSYSGGVVALYAMAYPTRVNRLVLMCSISPRYPAPYNDEKAEEKKAESRLNPSDVKRLEEMRQAGLETSGPVVYCREHGKVHWPCQMGRPEALARMRSDPCVFQNEWPQNLSEHWRKHFPERSRKYDWRPRAASLNVPVLVIHGMEDLIPLESSQEWAGTLPNARLLAIPGSGHFPHLEAPEIYFPAVNRFLAGEWPDGAEVIQATK
jgi:pimeloyl-ACP methyl ester carboxylesterase